MAGISSEQREALNNSMWAAKDINLGTLVNCFATKIDSAGNDTNVLSTVVSSYITQIDNTSTTLNSWIGHIQTTSTRLNSYIAFIPTIGSSTTAFRSYMVPTAAGSISIILGATQSLTTLYGVVQFSATGTTIVSGTTLAIDATTPHIINVQSFSLAAGFALVYGR